MLHREKYKVQNKAPHLGGDKGRVRKGFFWGNVSFETQVTSKSEPGNGALGKEREEVALKELWIWMCK